MNKELIIENFKNPKNYGKLDTKNVSKASNTSCGDEITMFLKIENGIVTDVKFEAVGCSICIASASLLTEKIKGKNINEIKNMKEEYPLELIEMEDISPRKTCATLCMKALKDSINI
jgi:nitrogen fixation protein NifU and related proteins